MKITTVRGDIAPQDLGYTTMHDHTFVDLRIAGEFMKNMFPDTGEGQLAFCPENYGFLKTGTYLMSRELQIVDDMDYLLKEYAYFKAIGGKSIVDPAPVGIRGSADKLKEFSELSGLNLICATGIYTATSRPQEYLGKGEDFMYQSFRKEIEKGIGGTDVKPGILKAAIATYGSNGIADEEISGVRACARLSAETGMSIHLHTDPMISGDDVVDAVKMAIDECGAKADRIVVCHTDNRLASGVMVADYLEDINAGRNIDIEMHKKLLDMGVNIGLDTWGMPIANPNFFMADDFERTKALVAFIDLGYDSQITLGNDFSSKLAGRSYGGFGCVRFAEFGLSMLEQLGRGKSIQRLTIENPARILAC
jgi:phosphotriesterase-related protein